MTTLQSFLKTLKTTKRTYPSSIYNILLISSSSSTTQILGSPETPISDLTLSTLRRIVSDPDIKSYKCVSFLRFILENPSLFSFRPDLTTHLSLSLRVLSERKFSLARELLEPDVLRYPFSDIASRALECSGFEKKVVARLFNSMIAVYSDNGRYEEVVEVFEFMKNNEIEIDEKTLTLHLLNLRRSGDTELAYEFFRLMVASELDVVSVYSLTVVVSALCCSGEIKRARELVEEVEVKPNIVTFKCMIDCCVKRWDFKELDLVLALMDKESVVLDLDSYKILIDGFVSYGKIEEAEGLVSTMHDEKLNVETYLYNLVINGYARLGLVEKAFEMHSEMSSRGVVSNKDTYWGLMNGLCKAGRVCEALRLFDELRVNEFEVDEAMYTTLIEGCCREGMVDNALELVAEMVKEGLVPDGTVFERLADVLSEVNRVEASMMITFVVKSGIKPSSCNDVIKGEDNLSTDLLPTG